ncbi:uncharacterized protein C2845_PM13G18190 [Panicum miliaceum]|uniref:Uncharacterized protein n=1 Tax=Panicum miliaceum TaxID=4540 RepID=A0A3L6RJK2_PANMI|nr:uncharacterized protein C2845_PM13G18190 [Panicum miliaceum]
MEPHGSLSAGRPRPVDLAKTKAVVAMSKGDESERKYFTRLIQEMEEEEGEESGKTTKERPLPHIVKYHGKCLTNEEQLVSELMARVRPEQKLSLPMWRSIILSCLIQERTRSIIHPAGCELSDVSVAALLCIAKEADLTCKLLRLEAPIDDEIITQGTTIRLCALSLMNYTRDNSVSASAVMLGMAKEAEMMSSWMHKNKKPIEFDVDPIPSDMWDCNYIRRHTLDFMVNNILKNSSAAEHKTVKEEPASEHMTVKEEPAAEHMTVKEEPARSGPGGDGDNIAADGAANTTGGSQYKKGGEKSNKWKGSKNFGGEKSNKRKRKEEDVFGKIWCWERLVIAPASCVKWSDYRSYLEKYYDSNASGFVAAAGGGGGAKNPQSVTDMVLAAVKFVSNPLASLLNHR